MLLRLGMILSDLYRAFWYNTTKKPWTYIMREWTVRHPKQAAWVIPVSLVGVITLQVMLPHTVYHSMPRHVALVLLGDFLFLLAGHLYWRTGKWLWKENGKK